MALYAHAVMNAGPSETLSAGVTPPAIGCFPHGQALGILIRPQAAEGVKALAENLLPQLEPLEVLASRTGLVMLPYRDTAQGTAFHLGEVLAAEAHIRLLARSGVEGYAACIGRDLEHAMGVALLDAAFEAGIGREAITALVEERAAHLAALDEARLRQIEATRVEMETF